MATVVSRPTCDIIMWSKYKKSVSKKTHMWHIIRKQNLHLEKNMGVTPLFFQAGILPVGWSSKPVKYGCSLRVESPSRTKHGCGWTAGDPLPPHRPRTSPQKHGCADHGVSYLDKHEKSPWKKHVATRKSNEYLLNHRNSYENHMNSYYNHRNSFENPSNSYENDGGRHPSLPV